MNKVKILVVDNDESLLNLLRLYLEAEGYEPLLAESPAEALESVKEGPPSVALVDRILNPPLRLDPLLARRPDHTVRQQPPTRYRREDHGPEERGQPPVSTQDLDGLALARRLQRTYPFLPIILMTAHPTIASAWEAGRLGVYYLTKPFITRDLFELIQKVLRERQNQRTGRQQRVPQPEEPESPAALLKELGTLKDYEHGYLIQMLTFTKGNIERAAKLAGEAQTTFVRLLKKHDLNPKHFLDKNKEQ